MNDLFGEAIRPHEIAKARAKVSKGYRYFPGSGPAGETCRTCKHILHTGNDGRYKKCALVNFTRGPATDIKVKSPACKFWKKL